MTEHKKLTIGLFGFGVVGEGLYQILEQTPSLQATLKKICIKHPEKPRNAPAELFTCNPDELLGDREINVIVEVIDDADAAFEIASVALKNGKCVVSASKKMIAEHLPELLTLQRETGQSLLYESAACASIPVLRNLEEYYDNDLLYAVQGIVNGSTNFILSRMTEQQASFQHALETAQRAGFAESDPTLDVEGYDAANKWVIILAHAYGIVSRQSDVLFSGIQNITAQDTQYAAQQGYKIKLVATARKLNDGTIAAFVLPRLVPPDSPLAFVNNEYNGISIESGLADEQFFYGKGAGGLPTGTAVLSDLSALRYNYHYEYKKRYVHQPATLSDDYYLRVRISTLSAQPLPEHRFREIYERHYSHRGNYLTGSIHCRELKNADWWKAAGVSLLLLPEPIHAEAEIAAAFKSNALVEN